MRHWTKNERSSLSFGIPMIWREQQNHHDDCYFCMVPNIVKFNKKKTRKTITYPSLLSARRPVPHTDDIPIPIFSGFPDDDNQDPLNVHVSAGTSREVRISERGEKFNQEELNDLIRDLKLSKYSSELLASRLNEKNLLTENTFVSFYRQRHAEFLPLFEEEGDFSYCKDVEQLLYKLGVEDYNPESWRLFIDSSTRSLKCVLLHNTNSHPSIPIGYSTKLKEQHQPMKVVIDKLNYTSHNWPICVDLKMVNYLLGQQSGYTKYPCFICFWDSRARDQHWQRTTWPVRYTLKVGEKISLIVPSYQEKK